MFYKIKLLENGSYGLFRDLAKNEIPKYQEEEPENIICDPLRSIRKVLSSCNAN